MTQSSTIYRYLMASHPRFPGGDEANITIASLQTLIQTRLAPALQHRSVAESNHDIGAGVGILDMADGCRGKV